MKKKYCSEPSLQVSFKFIVNKGLICIFSKLSKVLLKLYKISRHEWGHLQLGTCFICKQEKETRVCALNMEFCLKSLYFFCHIEIKLFSYK